MKVLKICTFPKKHGILDESSKEVRKKTYPFPDIHRTGTDRMTGPNNSPPPSVSSFRRLSEKLRK